MRPRWIRYEFRQLGWIGTIAPVVMVLVIGAVAAIMAAAGSPEARIARLLSTSLEFGPPLAAGVVAIHILVHDPARDLMLALPTPYWLTVLRRLVLLITLIAAWSVLAVLLLRVAGLWWVPGHFLQAQLTWLPPLVWLTAVAALLAMLSGSQAASTAILAGVWVLQHTLSGVFASVGWLRPFFLFATTYTPTADYWLSNRWWLLLQSVVVLVVVTALLSDSESLAVRGEA